MQQGQNLSKVGNEQNNKDSHGIQFQIKGIKGQELASMHKS